MLFEPTTTIIELGNRQREFEAPDKDVSQCGKACMKFVVEGVDHYGCPHEQQCSFTRDMCHMHCKPIIILGKFHGIVFCRIDTKLNIQLSFKSSSNHNQTVTFKIKMKMIKK